MKRIKYAITHPGHAHPDDMMAWSRILFTYPDLRLYRRDPVEMELNDPNVIVFDVGGRHEPEMNNFDHHDNGEQMCSFGLVLKEFDDEDFYNWALEQKWFKYVNNRDLHVGRIPESSFALHYLLTLFSTGEEEIFRQFMSSWWDSQYYHFKNDEPIGEVIEKMQGTGDIRTHMDQDIIYSIIGADHKHISKIRGRLEEMWRADEQAGNASYTPHLSISPDDRGPGWMVHRRKKGTDDFNLHLLATDPQVSWSSDQGFLAKISERLPIYEVLEIVKKARIS
jgi:hypothetical protein